MNALNLIIEKVATLFSSPMFADVLDRSVVRASADGPQQSSWNSRSQGEFSHANHVGA